MTITSSSSPRPPRDPLAAFDLRPPDLGVRAGEERDLAAGELEALPAL